MATPFAIPFDQGMIGDLERRLRAIRWADAVTTDWTHGVERGFREHLVRYWREEYRWADRVAVLNRLPHFRSWVDGHGLHFLHFRERGACPTPLLLMNGWPSSFVEYQKLAPLLAGGEPSFDVVIPTLPGFGFSDRPTRPYEVEPADLYPKLMTALGYERFMVAGTDIGSGVATRIALHHPDRVLAVHVDVGAGRAARVRALAGRAEDLGRDHDVVARHLQAAQRLAGDLLRPAAGVDVGGVDEVDPGLERPGDEPLGLVRPEGADLAPQASLPPKVIVPRHSSETKSPVWPSRL